MSCIPNLDQYVKQCPSVVSFPNFLMIQEAVPNAHITYTHDSALPFPADLDDSGLRQILGDIPQYLV